MVSPQLVAILMTIVAIGAIIVAFVVRRTPVTVANLSSAIDTFQPLEEKLVAICNTVVQGIEQIRRDGRMTNDEAFSSAVEQVQAWLNEVLPSDVHVTSDQVVAGVNQAVLVASGITAAIIANKAIAATAAAPVIKQVAVQPLHKHD